jgi:regulator of cell morphogenesis and NO signaling
MRSEFFYNLPESSKILSRYHASIGSIAANTGACQMARMHLIEDLTLSLHDIDRASAAVFEPYPVGMLVDYLIRTHRYYTGKALPEIELTLKAVIQNAPEGRQICRYGMVLYKKYVDESEAHFQFEETRLFPYAMALERAAISGNKMELNYSAAAFSAEHPHCEIELNKVIAYLTKLGSTLSGNFAFGVMLQQLSALDADMKLHGMIEDDVLVPKLLALEARTGS